MNKIASLEAKQLNDLRQKEIEIQKLQIQKAEKDRWFLIGAIIFLFIISAVLYNRFRLKQKSNNQLQKAFSNLQSTQHQLIEQEKLASLGALAAGIAHEIQNPLNFVNNFSDVSNELLNELSTIEDEKERDEAIAGLKNNLNKISHHGKRASNIIRNMLMHSRKESGQKQPTDINALVDEALSLSFHSIQARYPGFKCQVLKDYTEGLPMIKIVSSDVSRVVLNILNNAFYALHEKSKSLNHDLSYAAKVELSTRQNGSLIRITIKDNGSGIPDAYMQNIFEPFFTSKPSNEGTGLGLSISYDIVKAHGGEITVDNSNGTTFNIDLPVT
jgi:two-component system, NtrC family, sensor kinase